MAKDEKFRIVFAGGGSGGHVYPTLAVLAALKKRLAELHAPFEATRVGPHDGYETLFENEGVKISTIAAGKIRRYASLANIVDIPKFCVGIVQALFKLYFIMPDAVFSKGGTGALPVVLAAWFYRIPVMIHESDARPGVNNLVSARFAKKVFVSFAEAANYFAPDKVVVTGTPLRAELFTANTTKDLAKDALGFSSSTPLLLILGGSQGARRINEFILSNLPEIIKITQVLHQTGLANLGEAQQLSRAALIDGSYKNRYKAVGYFESDMGLALTAADLVVMRPGSTLAEIAAFGIPAVLIPIAESANDHQRANAYAFAKNGAAVVIEEANLLPGIFLAEAKKILENADVRAKMSASSSQLAMPGAAEKIVGEIIASFIPA